MTTWWSPETKAKTHESDCEGAETPILSPDGSRRLALDGIWDTNNRKLIAKLETNFGAGVSGFSHDQKLVLGSTVPGKKLDQHSVVAWDATTGRIVWHRHQLRAGEHRGDRQPSYESFGATFVNEKTGAMYGLGVVVHPERGPERVVFNDECWAGPTELPAAELPEFPRKKCPELLDGLDALVRSRAFDVF